MFAKALQYFHESLAEIKKGNLFDEKINNTFEMMAKALFNTEKQHEVKKAILETINQVFAQTRDSEDPPPFIYIIISLKDADIISHLEKLVISDFVQTKASETSVFHIVNIINTIEEKGISVDGFVRNVINSIQPTFIQDMVEAFAHLISLQHPKFVGDFVVKFMKMNNDSLLRNYINSTGRKAMLEAVKLSKDPMQLNRILKGNNKPPSE